MCIRFVYRGDDIITGFNFDIDPAVWDHQIITAPDRFYLGILRPDGLRHGYHGVHQNGNTGTLLYVHGNPSGQYQAGSDALTISDLTERLGTQGETAAQRVLDELILARVRVMTAPERTAFLAHVRDIVDSVEDNVTSVPVESVEPDDAKDTEEAE